MKYMTSIILLFFIILTLNPLFSQEQLARVSVEQEEIEIELKRLLTQNQMKDKELQENDLSQLRDHIREGIIVRKLLVSLALHSEITLDKTEIDKKLSLMKGEYSDEKWHDILEKQYYTEDSLRKVIEDSYLMDRVLDLKVRSKITLSDEELQSYYESHLEEFVTEHGTISYIDVKEYIRDTLLNQKGEEEVSRFIDDLYASAMFVEE